MLPENIVASRATLETLASNYFTEAKRDEAFGWDRLAEQEYIIAGAIWGSITRIDRRELEEAAVKEIEDALDWNAGILWIKDAWAP